ncbi:bifunctional copper resistance protein CopD/cytochrome c oxidase assembly protein [Pseudonocardia kujensis]|uniref:cytochrome c oxidase assembly protein n=1 Tax=Pseudonocardia kujensis TaxID=1128675 RepID=UPI001E3367B5|nr:cytochrome c oxidase assembly protein [Pseudonocardia kujensis]MCE0768235.1 bifunctional copper resistance protein CopD/cytochrome c oxidase assembly protein [Pseudonocardia kujensis]
MAQTTADPTPTTSARRPPSGVGGLVGLGIAVAILVAAGLTALTGSRPVENLGLPDPGTLTTIGLPAVRAAAEVCAVLAIGFLLLAAFFVAPQRSGYLDVAGYRGVRAASYAAAGWAVSALLLVPLSAADALGRPVVDVLDPELLVSVIPKLSDAMSWLLTAIVALLLLVACRLVLSWGWTVVAFGLALLGPLPVALTGHSAAGGSHDVATNSLVLHVLAASLWVGGLVAVLSLAAARADDDSVTLGVAVRRFSRVAFWCWVVLAVTGVLNALVRVSPTDLIGSTYGALLLGKTLALLALGGLGLLHRRHTVDAAGRGERGALLRLGGVEVLLMLATVGLAVALGRSAPPASDAAPPSRTEVVLGYDLDGPPTLVRLAFDWRFDLIFGTAAVLMAVLYLLGVRRLRLRGDAWKPGRTAAWLCGCAVLLIATSSGIGKYAPAMFSVHMGMHMMLTMLTPILLVLGAPVTLMLRALPVAGRGNPPGPREWLLAAVHSPVARFVTHPLFSLPVFVGSYYALYFSDLFGWALSEHWAHVAMNLHFLLAGLIFFWPVIGVDPSPRRLPPVVRLAVVFLSVPFHAFFGVALMGADTVIGEPFYRSLALPWVTDPLVDQKLGGGLAWASGEFPLLLVIIALLIQWSRHDERSARRDDRRADADGDAELKSYNEMLRRLARGGGPSGASEEISADRGGEASRDERRPEGPSDERESASASGIGAGEGRRGGTPAD